MAELVVLGGLALPVTAAVPAQAASSGTFTYVANNGSDDVSVINTTTNTVTATITVGTNPFAVAVSPDGT
ncbi:YncE family protein, partial [Kitasatospora sp. NPDC001175]